MKLVKRRHGNIARRVHNVAQIIDDHSAEPQWRYSRNTACTRAAQQEGFLRVLRARRPIPHSPRAIQDLARGASLVAVAPVTGLCCFHSGPFSSRVRVSPPVRARLLLGATAKFRLGISPEFTRVFLSGLSNCLLCVGISRKLKYG